MKTRLLREERGVAARLRDARDDGDVGDRVRHARVDSARAVDELLRRRTRQTAYQAAEAGVDDYIAKLKDDPQYYNQNVHFAESTRRDLPTSTNVAAAGSCTATSKPAAPRVAVRHRPGRCGRQPGRRSGVEVPGPKDRWCRPRTATSTTSRSPRRRQQPSGHDHRDRPKDRADDEHEGLPGDPAGAVAELDRPLLPHHQPRASPSPTSRRRTGWSSRTRTSPTTAPRRRTCTRAAALRSHRARRESA